MFDMGSVRFVNVSLVRLNVKTCFKLGLNVTRVKTLKQINMLRYSARVGRPQGCNVAHGGAHGSR